MVSKHGGLSDPPASRLEKELQILFGRDLLQASIEVDLAEQLSAEKARQVARAANRLQDRAGHPREQVAIVADLSPEVALLLCAWLHKGGGKVIGRLRH